MKKKVAKTARRTSAKRAPTARNVKIQQVIGYERLQNGTTIVTALGKDGKVYTWRGLEPCGWTLSEFSEADLMQRVAANTPKQTAEDNAPVELNRAARRAAAATAPKAASGGSAFEE